MSDHIDIALGAILLGSLLLYKGFIALREKRLISNIPTSNIRSVAMGLAEIKASVCETEEPLTAPISGRDCVHYSCKIQEYKRSKNRSYWKTVRTLEEGRYFYVRDDTGAVLVDSQGASIDISPSATRRGTDQSVQRFLEERGVDYSGLFGIRKKMRVIEHILYPGQPLYIMGTAKDNPHVEDASVPQGYRDVMIGKGKHEEYFVISDKKEKDLLGAKKRWSLGIWAGPVLIVGGLWLLWAML